jgi:octaprenyl-diphosphate synthase
MSQIDQIKAPIQKELDEFERYFRSTLNSTVPLLNLITNYVLRRKGKQLRPMFVFLSAGMYGNINHSTYVAAALIELLHTATLVHDDVVDNSNERRGFFSIHAIWKSKIAVLLGDYLLAKGLLLSVQNKEYELLEIVSEAVREMSEGELLQLQKSRKLNITEAEYFDIIRKKTATLIAACTACGSKSAGNPPDEVGRFRQFGGKIGIAFQIKDDLFDYLPHESIGKPVGNDIQEKKMTLPLIYAMTNSSRSERNHILGIVRNSRKKDSQVREVIDFVKKSGGVLYAEKIMNQYKNEALDMLEPFPSTPIRQALASLVSYIVERKK